MLIGFKGKAEWRKSVYEDRKSTKTDTENSIEIADLDKTRTETASLLIIIS